MLDVLGAVCVMLGAFLCLAAALGLARFPDVLSRMHAATKPQTLGLILVVTGVELSLRSWAAFGTVVLIASLQFMTAPSRRTWSAGPSTAATRSAATCSTATTWPTT